MYMEVRININANKNSTNFFNLTFFKYLPIILPPKAHILIEGKFTIVDMNTIKKVPKKILASFG